MNTPDTHAARRLLAIGLVAGLALTACGGSGESADPSGTDAPTPSTADEAAATGSETEPDPIATGGDGPATLWVRAADAPMDEAMVELWNEQNPDRTIEMVTIPDEQYVQKFIQATRSGDVPDIAVVDIANAVTLVDAGLLIDITDRVEGLDYVDTLAKGAMDVSTSDGSTYAVPHQLDVSLMFYNKSLFEQAGLDPEAPPTNNDELLDAAEAITGLGNDTYGFYFAGNCAGCNAYTTLPLVWANGGNLLADRGQAATVDDPAVAEALDVLRAMWDGGMIPQSAQEDNGATWLNAFQSGTIGMQPLGAFAIGIFGAEESLDFGVAPLPGDDGTGAFLGGDVAGIPLDAEQSKTAWDFLEWSMTPEVQESVVAETGHLVVRADLIDNPVTSASPLLQEANRLIATAEVPVTPEYNALFIDPASPFLQLIRDYVFEGQDQALAEAQTDFQERIG